MLSVYFDRDQVAHLRENCGNRSLVQGCKIRAGFAPIVKPLTPETHKKSDIDKVAVDAMASGGTTLICWQHEDIPSISNVIVGNQTTVPQKWPGDRFDIVWLFDLDKASNSYSFNQVPQCLLAGDSPEPIQDT